MAWTDERMNDLVRHIDASFKRTDAAIAGLNAKVDRVRMELDGRIARGQLRLDEKIDRVRR